jgi:hypothetical protein
VALETGLGAGMSGGAGEGLFRHPLEVIKQAMPAHKRIPCRASRMAVMYPNESPKSKLQALGRGRDFGFKLMPLSLDPTWITRHSDRFRRGKRCGYSSSLSVSAETIL